jgi:hypothetical protein
MGLQEELTKIFKDWGKELNSQERVALEKDASEYTDVEVWKAKHIALVATSGMAAGVTGGPWSYAAIIADLLWCRKVAPLGCLGIGYIWNEDVDIDQDMNMIMAIWAGVGLASVSVPTGKIGVKVSPKATMKLGIKIVPKLAAKGTGKLAGEVFGKVISKTALKTSSKALSKLTAKIVDKAVAKVFAKAAAKVGVGWIPIIGGVVSGGINWWLLSTMMDAAEQYYANPYVVFDENELVEV